MRMLIFIMIRIFLTTFCPFPAIVSRQTIGGSSVNCFALNNCMKTRNIRIGDIGENAAKQYLLGNGYSILYLNFKRKFGEIDIIARDISGYLVIFEVKTIVSRQTIGGSSVNCFTLNNLYNSQDLFHAKQCLEPEDNLSRSKLLKLRRISQFFINSHPHLINEVVGWRIDLIAVILYRDESGKLKAGIRHYDGIG